jgi:hypothetical protein
MLFIVFASTERNQERKKENKRGRAFGKKKVRKGIAGKKVLERKR